MIGSALDDAVALLASAFLGATIAAVGTAAILDGSAAGAPSTMAVAAALAGAVAPLALGLFRGLGAVATVAACTALAAPGVPGGPAGAPAPRLIERPAGAEDGPAASGYERRLASVSSMIGMPSRTG